MSIELSVAMCTYNGAAFLPAQLQSIVTQTRLPDELVICDDRSSDDTVGIINAFAHTAPFPVRFEINETNLNSTKNFERAISQCRGRIIALSDQDDLWLSQKLERICTVLDANPNAGYVFSDADLVDREAVPLGETAWRVVKFRGASQFRESNNCTFC